MVLKGAIAKLHDSIPPGFFYFSAEAASGFVAQTLPTLNVAEYLLSFIHSAYPELVEGLRVINFSSARV
jgi:hypothetical protein